MRDLQAIFLTRASLVWLILMLATATSWYVGNDSPSGVDAQSIKLASLAIMLIAFIKVRLVIMHFMEVTHAPLPLRLACEAWVVLICGLVLLLTAYGEPISEVFLA